MIVRVTKSTAAATPNDHEIGTVSAVRILLQGRVQGAGVRPAVARLARRLHLQGRIANNSDGVLIQLEGSSSAISQFLEMLNSVLPEGADHHVHSVIPDHVQGYVDLVIAKETANSEIGVDVPVDRAICQECLQELNDSSDRRFSHAFNSCTQCGPRFSMIRAMPYERGDTTMADFPMCRTCDAEYLNSSDRRFHAQSIACPECGPQLSFESNDGQGQLAGIAAVEAAAAVIQNGGILALKGLGGYQLICNAANDDAVQRLRHRKQRLRKPLAVMIPVNYSNGLSLNTAEFSSLNSWINPIVILQRNDFLAIAQSVNRCTDTIGVFLPTTPLHAMLLQRLKAPVVVTSGNLDGVPLEFQNQAARADLSSIVDGWLLHDREIERPVDDSVVRVIAGRSVTLRAARGIAPMRLPIQTSELILAVGGEQKVAVALSNGRQSVLGPHIGDMHTIAARRRFIEQQEALSKLYGVRPDLIVHDLHPDYFTTRWAMEQGVRTMAIQHHHAHIASAMLEHGLLDQVVLGVAFDGTGYGTDGSSWGGEFLLATEYDFHRVATLLPFVLPGGEMAIRQPWRTAVSLLTAAMPDLSADHIAELLIKSAKARNSPMADFGDALPSPDQIRDVQRLVQLGHGAVTSSMGRLFDGIAAIVLGTGHCSFEAELAMRLEAACADDSSILCTSGLLPLVDVRRSDVETGVEKQRFALDWRPLLRRLVTDIQSGCCASTMAILFHQAIADAVATVADQYSGYPVVLSGGCFQNRVLTERVVDRLRQGSRLVAAPGTIPPNDGGLAAGQLVIAAARLRRT